MTARTEARIAALGRIDEAAAEHVALGARRRVEWAAPLPAPRRRASAPRRVALAGALALALAGALLVTLRPMGGDSANAGLLRRVSLAVTPPPHTVQHIRQVLRQGSLVLTTESWQSVDDPYTLRWRQTSSTRCGGSFVAEYSSTLSRQQWFDADHNRVLRRPLVPAEVRAAPPAGGARAQFDATVSFAFALRQGDAHVAGSTTMDGNAVTQITWPPDPSDPTSRNVLYVETATGVPVAYQWGGGKLDATSGVGYQSFPVYEFLPESASTLRALSVEASHPDATLQPLMTERQFSTHTQDAQRRHCGGVG
jgi:hypothetical protein